MRRDRDRGAPHLDHPCEEFLDRRPCFAVAQMPRGQRQVRRARLYRETHLLAADRRALHQPGQLMPAGIFEMRCFARRRPDNPQRRRRPRRRCDGRIGQRRSVVRCGQGDANARTRNDRENTMPACTERGRSNLAGQRWHGASRAGDRAKNSQSDGAGVVEPALYTVEGRQTVDLRQKCNSALIRKAKLPARSCGRPSFLAGTADRAH
jgi:hypothetical protein